MFEAYTYERLMKETLAMAPDGVDTRQGSIFFDAVSATINKIAKLYTDLDRVFELVFITTAKGEYLDLRAAEFGLTRRGATPSRYLFEYTGTKPAVGWRFFHNDSGYYFTLTEVQDDDGYKLCLEAETTGVACNDIQVGDIAVPVDTVVGMTSANFGEVYEYGTDVEEDSSLRARVLEKISGYAANGNRQHYKTWCESVPGVGRARIEPLWNGENTVKAVLISPLGLPVSDSVVAAVQRYVDPNDLGMTVVIGGKTYNVGDGLGNGRANIGAHFTAISAEALEINVAFSAELTSGQTKATVETKVAEVVADYLQTLAANVKEDDPIIVRVNSVGALLAGLSGYIVDYSGLTLNGKAENVIAGTDEAPVLGEVRASVVS